MFLFALRMAMTLLRPYDLRKITADAILLRETQSKKMGILMFWQHFQCEFGLNKV